MEKKKKRKEEECAMDPRYFKVVINGIQNFLGIAEVRHCGAGFRIYGYVCFIPLLVRKPLHQVFSLKFKLQTYKWYFSLCRKLSGFLTLTSPG